jgi:hypothetical protein
MYEEADAQFHAFLTSTLDGQVHAATTLPREIASCAQKRGGWVDPVAKMDASKKWQISLPRREPKTDFLVYQPVASLLLIRQLYFY